MWRLERSLQLVIVKYQPLLSCQSWLGLVRRSSHESCRGPTRQPGFLLAGSFLLHAKFQWWGKYMSTYKYILYKKIHGLSCMTGRSISQTLVRSPKKIHGLRNSIKVEMKISKKHPFIRITKPNLSLKNLDKNKKHICK